MSSPHRMILPEGLMAARGYSHAVTAGAGRTVWVAGQLAADASGSVVGSTFVEQFDLALENVVAVLRAASAESHHLVTMQIFTTNIDAYLASTKELGPIYRRHMGAHFPAMAVLGVAALVDPAAVVEIMATAVVPKND